MTIPLPLLSCSWWGLSYLIPFHGAVSEPADLAVRQVGVARAPHHPKHAHLFAVGQMGQQPLLFCLHLESQSDQDEAGEQGVGSMRGMSPDFLVQPSKSCDNISIFE